jgi:hypothetical protein
MGRQSPIHGPSEKMPTIALLATSGVAGSIKEYNFTDGSITYFERIFKSAFSYTMIDNIGSGEIRVTYNRPALSINTYTDGAKTLKSGDSLYVEEDVWHIKIYFVQDSTVELVLKSDKDV